MEILACIYVVIGLASYVLTIKNMKKTGYIDWEDLTNGFILFGIAWPIGIPVYLFSCYGRGIGDKILRWVNKK